MKHTSKISLICLCFIVAGLNSTALCAEQGILDELCGESKLRDELQEQAVQYRQEGLRAQQAGKLNEAISLYQKAIGIDPSFAEAYNDLGIVF